MDVMVMETEAYRQLERRLETMERLFLQVVEELKEAKNDRWMSVKEVMEYTGFGIDWVMARKQHFGFFQDGKDLKFWNPNVIKYMSLRSVEPKIDRQLLKLKARSDKSSFQ